VYIIIIADTECLCRGWWGDTC